MNGSNPVHKDDLRSEYDFSTGVRGKHYQQYLAGTNVVVLDADVAQAFKDSESVEPGAPAASGLGQTSTAAGSSGMNHARITDSAPCCLVVGRTVISTS